MLKEAAVYAGEERLRAKAYDRPRKSKLPAAAYEQDDGGPEPKPAAPRFKPTRPAIDGDLVDDLVRRGVPRADAAALAAPETIGWGRLLYLRLLEAGHAGGCDPSRIEKLTRLAGKQKLKPAGTNDAAALARLKSDEDEDGRSEWGAAIEAWRRELRA